MGPHEDHLASVTTLRKSLGQHVGILQERSRNSQEESYAAKDLVARSMEDSWDRVVLPLASQPHLRHAYLNHMGYVRFGKILEDLDTFAVWLSYRHNQGKANHGQPPRHHPICVVTACVDRIDVKQGEPIPPDKDVVIEGHVSWVGNSSLETTMRLRHSVEAPPALEAKFVMVSLHPCTFKPVPVHPLAASGATEEAIVAEGQTSRATRKAQAKESLLRTPPSPDESRLLHDIFRRTVNEQAHSFKARILPPDTVWMDDLQLKSCHICHPERRNLYNKIFGGYLMRLSFELAWTNARTFSGGSPRILAVDDIMFEKSVDVGSLLYLSSEVCFVQDQLVQIRVHAEVVDVEKSSRTTTNTFHFTFSVDKPVPSVLPRSYAHGMLYLSGKRHFDEAMRHRS